MERKIITLGTCLLLFAGAAPAGCTADMGEAQMESDSEQQFTVSVRDAYGDPYYDQEVGGWIQPAMDPYRIDNVHRAYKNLYEGTSRQSLALDAIAVPAQLPVATHRVILFFPKTMEQLETLQLNEYVYTQHYPLDHMLLPEEQTKNLTVSPHSYQPVTGKYWYQPVADEDYVPSEEELPFNLTPEPMRIPKIYAVWPVKMELPADHDYEIQYEVVLPFEHLSPQLAMSASADLLTALDQEINDNVFNPFIIGGGTPARSYGHLYVYCSKLDVTMPVCGITVTIRNGSYAKSTQTDNNGKWVYSTTEFVPNTAIIEYAGLGTGWKIQNKHSNIITLTYSLPPAPAPIKHTVPLNTDNGYIFTICTAAEYYKNGNHELSHSTLPAIAKIYYHANAGTCTYHTEWIGDCYISMYRKDTYNILEYFNVSCHELGHSAHASSRGRTTYNQSDGAAKETWAVFAGWYLSEKYFKTRGIYTPPTVIWIKPPGPLPTYLCRNCRPVAACAVHSKASQHIFYKKPYHYTYQSVSRGIDDIYTALYIDLYDVHNQALYYYWAESNTTKYLDYPNDNVAFFDPVDIQYIAFNYQRYRSILDYLKNYVGYYYDQQTYEDLVHHYWTWKD